MAKLEYFIVCESTSVDAENNRISLFHVLEDIFPDGFPYVLPRIEAVSLWNLDPQDADTDFQVTLEVYLPGNPAGVLIPMNLSKGVRRCRAAVALMNIPLDRSGELRFEVKLNGLRGATHIVSVHDTPTLKSGEDLLTDAPHGGGSPKEQDSGKITDEAQNANAAGGLNA